MSYDLSYKQRNRQTDIITFTNTSLGTQLNMEKKFSVEVKLKSQKLELLNHSNFPNKT